MLGATPPIPDAFMVCKATTFIFRSFGRNKGPKNRAEHFRQKYQTEFVRINFKCKASREYFYVDDEYFN